MINEQMTDLINKRTGLNENDYIAIQSIWDKEIEVLSFSVEAAIDFINTASKELLYWSSEVWEDVSKILKSIDLVNAMKNSALKYEDITDELLNCALDAEKAINDK